MLFLSAALAAGTSANAQDTGAYLGGALGVVRFTEWCDTGGSSIQLESCDDRAIGWRAIAGYRFNPYIGLEASVIDWGEVSANTPTVRVRAKKQRSIGLAGVASFPVSPRVSLSAKLGLFQTEQETETQATRADRSDTETHYGIGARYDLGRRWAVRADWEQADKLKARMLSLALERQL